MNSPNIPDNIIIPLLNSSGILVDGLLLGEAYKNLIQTSSALENQINSFLKKSPLADVVAEGLHGAKSASSPNKIQVSLTLTCTCEGPMQKTKITPKSGFVKTGNPSPAKPSSRTLSSSGSS